jgi:hypothetical protein
MSTPLATHEYTAGGLQSAFEFLKRTRWELRQLRWARVWADRFEVIDVNKDTFEIRGLGYQDADIIPVLRMVNAAFNPDTIHAPTTDAYKEFDTGRCHPWAVDRCM